MSEDALTRQPYYGKLQVKKEKPLPEIGPHKTIREINIEAAKRVIEKKKLAWQAARIRLDRMVADAAVEHTILPNNYWLEEQRARALYGAAILYLEALTEL
jgi:hypothetical protein